MAQNVQNWKFIHASFSNSTLGLFSGQYWGILGAKIILLNCHPGGRAANDAEEKHKEEVRKAGGAEKPEKSHHIEDAEKQHVASL